MALRSPGRPKDLEKRGAILDAAQSLFAERGIDGAPIEAIAARSGVSKVTVYGHFGDKASIFQALVERENERFTERLAAVTQSEGSMEARLTQLGETVISVMMEPCHLALDRIVALEAQRPSAEHVLNVLARLKEGLPALQPLEANTPALREEPRADVQRYDRLREVRA